MTTPGFKAIVVSYEMMQIMFKGSEITWPDWIKLNSRLIGSLPRKQREQVYFDAERGVDQYIVKLRFRSGSWRQIKHLRLVKQIISEVHLFHGFEINADIVKFEPSREELEAPSYQPTSTFPLQTRSKEMVHGTLA